MIRRLALVLAERLVGRIYDALVTAVQATEEPSQPLGPRDVKIQNDASHVPEEHKVKPPTAEQSLRNRAAILRQASALAGPGTIATMLLNVPGVRERLPPEVLEAAEAMANARLHGEMCARVAEELRAHGLSVRVAGEPDPFFDEECAVCGKRITEALELGGPCPHCGAGTAPTSEPPN